MDLVIFYLLGGLAVAASLVVIAQRNPMYSVMALIASFGALAGLYVLLDSPFAAVAQIIIYAGAIMVLFLFVVMLLNAPREDVPGTGETPRVPAAARRFGAVLAALLVVELVWALSRVGSSPVAEDATAAATVSSVREIGRVLFTDHAFAFEVTSVLILVAMVGAVTLAKRHL